MPCASVFKRSKSAVPFFKHDNYPRPEVLAGIEKIGER